MNLDKRTKRSWTPQRRQVQRDNAQVGKGIGLYGPDAGGQPQELSVRRSQQGADTLSCLPRKSLQSSKGSRDGRRFAVIGGVRSRLGIANAVVP